MMAPNDDLECRELTPEETEQISKLFNDSFVRIGPSGYCMARHYKNLASDIYNMELRKGDTFVASYPRSGTTLTQELVWLVANNFDYDKAAAVVLTKRYVFSEFAMYFDDATIKMVMDEATDQVGAKMEIERLSTPIPKVLMGVPSPRFIKTHSPLSLLPPKILDTAKVVYVARDPRAVLVSYYHLCRLLKVLKFKETATMKDMWYAMKRGLLIRMPFFAHVKEAWARRHHPNLLFLFYEKLINDLSGSIRRVAEFLGKEVTAEQVESLCNHLSFENFKNNKSVNLDKNKGFGYLTQEEKFIRKGKTEGWRDYFDEEMTRDAEQWIADNLRDTDLRFPSMNN